jgi:predicted DNA-binding protein
MSTTLTKPTPCRFHPQTKERIDQIARQFGIKPSALIRHAVDHQLNEFERAGRITIEKRKA